MSLSRRARKQLIALVVLVVLVLVVGVGGNQLRLAMRASDAAEGLKLGTAAFERGEYAEALSQFNRYFKVPEHQTNADVIYMHAKSRLETPQDGGVHYRTALGLARRAVDNDPDSVRNRLLVLETLIRSRGGSLPDILSEIDSVLELDPRRTDLRLYRADVLLASERPDDALNELRSIIARDPSSIEAMDRINRILISRPAEYNAWVASLDQKAQDNPEVAAFDIARIHARVILINTGSRDNAGSAIAASRTMTAYDILTQSLLQRSVADVGVFRAALAACDEVERAIRFTRPVIQDEAQATQDRLEAVDAAARGFVAAHTGLDDEDPVLDADRAQFVLAAMEWLWTSDRGDLFTRMAEAWRDGNPEISTDPAQVAVEALIALTGALPEEQLIELPERSTSLAANLWLKLSRASVLLRDREITELAEVLNSAVETAEAIDNSIRFTPAPTDQRATVSFLAEAAMPALALLRAEAAFASGDTARAMSLWRDAAMLRRVWDQPALQLLSALRDRGSIIESEQMSGESMLRGATIGTGLSMIDARVQQYALGLIPYDTAEMALRELRNAGLPEAPIAVADFRLALVASMIDPARREQRLEQAAEALASTAEQAVEETLTAQVLVRMLGAAQEYGMLGNPSLIPASVRDTSLRAIDTHFAAMDPESKYIASTVEVALTGSYGATLARFSAEVRRLREDPSALEPLRFENERVLAQLTADLARTYQALADEAYERTLSLAESNPDNAAAQLLFIESLLRAGEVPPARAEPLTDALERLKAILGPKSYTYNLAESRRLYANPQTRTPEVARQEIITRLDPFVEGQQSATAPVEVLHLVSRWWALLPNSLDRRLTYLRRALRTSQTAWGIYPDLVSALAESNAWDEAATVLVQWGRQLTPPQGLLAQRRDLAQVVGERWTGIAAASGEDQANRTLDEIWAVAIRDALDLEAATGDPVDTLRTAQILLAAPDGQVSRAAAASVLGWDQPALDRIVAARQSALDRGSTVPDASLAAAVSKARDLLGSPPAEGGFDADQLQVLARAAQIIANHATLARFSMEIALGDRAPTESMNVLAPDPQAGLDALAWALEGASPELVDRARGLFFATAYQPETWAGWEDQARSAMLSAARTGQLTEPERRALVYPLSQLGEIDAAIELQRTLAQEGGADESSRLTDVVAIAEILRDAGQTQAAYEAITNLPETQRNQLISDTVAPGTQALVALLELETAQPQTPVTTAFARRVIDQPREMLAAFGLAIESAAGSQPRLTLLRLVSDELAERSASRPQEGEFRPAIAILWFTAATAAREDDPLRSQLLSEVIARMDVVGQIPNDEARLFAYRHKAYCEIELGRLDAGIRNYRQAIELDGEDPATLNNLADALNRRGQAAEAVGYAQRAIESATEQGFPHGVVSIFHDTLGKSHLAIGAVDEALIVLRTAIDLDSGNIPARISLAEAQVAAGESAEAVRATLEPIGPAAEQDLIEANRDRLSALRDRL